MYKSTTSAVSAMSSSSFDDKLANRVEDAAEQLVCVVRSIDEFQESLTEIKESIETFRTDELAKAASDDIRAGLVEAFVESSVGAVDLENSCIEDFVNTLFEELKAVVRALQKLERLKRAADAPAAKKAKTAEEI